MFIGRNSEGMGGVIVGKRIDLLIAIFILLVLAIIWSIIFRPEKEPPLKEFVGLLPVIIALLGASKEKKKQEKRKVKKKKAKPFRLTPSFDSGLYGGLIGGAIGGLILGVTYYVTEYASVAHYVTGYLGWRVIPLIFICFSAGGTLFGASIQLIILWFRHLVNEKKYSELAFNEVSGGIFVGAIGGASLGTMGAWIFAGPFLPFPFTDFRLIVIGSLLVGICFILSVLLYEYEEHWRNITRSLLISAVISTFLALLAIIVLELLNVKDLIIDHSTLVDVLAGGAIAGFVIGIILGFQIGCTLWLERLRQVVTSQ